MSLLRAIARIDVGAIERNCAHLAATASPAMLCAVVKANGYGHGALATARAALVGGARWLAVATAGEAAELREAGIDAPLLVMGALSHDELEVAIAAGADVVAWSDGILADIERIAGDRRVGVHVKLDTGMGRLGTRDPRRASEIVQAVLARPGLRLAGLMTHMATADDDPEYLDAQLDAFDSWVSPMKAANPDVIVHAANSATTLSRPGGRWNMVRCGIAVYGLDPFHRDPADHGLSPALTLESYVADLKRCGPGESVGYGRRWIAGEPSWIGTLPIGYADGVRRGLSNNGDVLVGGVRVPIIGTVSMDTTTILAGGDDTAPFDRGARAILIGAQGADRILAEDMAARLGTINYEVTCGVSPRVPRWYHRAGVPLDQDSAR